MILPFCKYHGAGNDFILIDNREGSFKLTSKQINQLCHRRFGVGADGLILLERADAPYRYYMAFYNSNGTEGTMCGNGGRCLVAFADMSGIKDHHFLAIDGEHRASVLEKTENNTLVKLQLGDVKEISKYKENSYVAQTGSLHLVHIVPDVQAVDVHAEGSYWRHHSDFGADGINVNFVEILDQGCLFVRTFERGVEAETWACGTGSVASALVASVHTSSRLTHWNIQTKGGNLEVDFQPAGTGFQQVFLTGGAVLVFRGEAEL